MIISFFSANMEPAGKRVRTASRKAEAEADDFEDEGDDGDNDDGTLYCVCRKPYDGSVMFQCDRCNLWCANTRARRRRKKA